MGLGAVFSIEQIKEISKVIWLSSNLRFLSLLRYLLHLGELTASVFVVAQVLLVAHQDDGDVGAKMFYLRSPFFRNVLCKEKTLASQIAC